MRARQLLDMLFMKQFQNTANVQYLIKLCGNVLFAHIRNVRANINFQQHLTTIILSCEYVYFNFIYFDLFNVIVNLTHIIQHIIFHATFKLKQNDTTKYMLRRLMKQFGDYTIVKSLSCVFVVGK